MTDMVIVSSFISTITVTLAHSVLQSWAAKVAPCPSGQFYDMVQVRCQLCTRCDQDSVVIQACRWNTDTQCEKCVDGLKPVLLKEKPACLNCQPCPPGFRVKRPCTPSSPTRCRRCPKGTFNERLSYSNLCLPCTSCGLRRTTRRCNVYHNSQCGDCKRGLYMDSGFKSCMRCRSCTSGDKPEAGCAKMTRKRKCGIPNRVVYVAVPYPSIEEDNLTKTATASGKLNFVLEQSTMPHEIASLQYNRTWNASQSEENKSSSMNVAWEAIVLPIVIIALVIAALVIAALVILCKRHCHNCTHWKKSHSPLGCSSPLHPKRHMSLGNGELLSPEDSNDTILKLYVHSKRSDILHSKSVIDHTWCDLSVSEGSQGSAKKEHSPDQEQTSAQAQLIHGNDQSLSQSSPAPKQSDDEGIGEEADYGSAGPPPQYPPPSPPPAEVDMGERPPPTPPRPPSQTSFQTNIPPPPPHSYTIPYSNSAFEQQRWNGTTLNPDPREMQQRWNGTTLNPDPQVNPVSSTQPWCPAPPSPCDSGIGGCTFPTPSPLGVNADGNCT